MLPPMVKRNIEFQIEMPQIYKLYQKIENLFRRIIFSYFKNDLIEDLLWNLLNFKQMISRQIRTIGRIFRAFD